MEQRDYERRNFISTLMKMEHGNLKAYMKDGLSAAKAEPDLFGHFIAWNQIKGKVRDSKTAYPVIALRKVDRSMRDLAENAVAHLLRLSPRDLLKAYDFSRKMQRENNLRPVSWAWEMFEDAVKNHYIRKREENNKWWDRTVLQHRKSMKDIYRIFRIKASDRAAKILFDREYPPSSIFAKVAGLKDMTPTEAASIILTEKIPFEVIMGAVPSIKNPDILLAMIEGMTGNQVVNNSKMLEKLGVKDNPILNAAYRQALDRASKDNRLNVLKAGVAAGGPSGQSTRSAISDDLLELQKTASNRQLGGIDGNWLILGDKSGSMSASVELAKEVASLIAERVKGRVWLIYFDTVPTAFDVTDKTLFQIREMTQRIKAQGGTIIGCGLDYLLQKGEEVDGIAIVSDGGDNYPSFGPVYRKYNEKFGKEPTVYHFDVRGDNDILSGQLPGVIEKFDLRNNKVDYYSLPNLVNLMKTNRYSLVDEIMNVPLLKIEDVFKKGVQSD